MKILLPPSEGKARPSSGPSLDLAALAWAEVAPVSNLRSALVEELEQVSARSDALDVLGVGVKVADAVHDQINLRELPCVPAWQLYTGVLYEAMDLATVMMDDGEAAARAREAVLVFSGLFGVTRVSDLLPAYRLSMGTKLPSTGNTATAWKRALRGLPLAENELVVDCRSGAYQVWNPPADCDWVEIRAVREGGGKRTVVSHNAKHFRGLLAGELIRADHSPSDAEELAEFARVLVDRGHAQAIELSEPTAKGPRSLTIVTVQD